MTAKCTYYFVFVHVQCEEWNRHVEPQYNQYFIYISWTAWLQSNKIGAILREWRPFGRSSFSFLIKRSSRSLPFIINYEQFVPEVVPVAGWDRQSSDETSEHSKITILKPWSKVAFKIPLNTGLCKSQTLEFRQLTEIVPIIWVLCLWFSFPRLWVACQTMVPVVMWHPWAITLGQRYTGAIS